MSKQKQVLVRKELFLDDRFIAEMSGLSRRFGKPRVYAENPVIRADQPWEKDAAFVDSGLVIYDEQEDLFKAWYQGGACYGPEDGSIMCYATSKDGINWDKPSLGVVEFEDSKDNNIVLRAQCMMHDPAPIIDYADPDPNRRYKAIWWGGRKDESQKDGWLLGHCVGFSPDGIHWAEHRDNPVWPGDGEVAVPFDIERCEGRLIMYNSIEGYGMRVVGQTESDDFVHWELPPKLTFKSDEQDPPGTEMAGLCAIDYFGNYIGMLYVIHNLGGITATEWKEIVEQNIKQGFFGPPITMNAVRCRTIHTELVASLDGIDWQRIQREPFWDLGGEGRWDEVISLAGRPIVARDKIWIYYTGQGRVAQTPGVSKPEKIGKWNVDTGLATLRLDGFASLDAVGEEGRLVTKEFELAGNNLLVNTDAGKGSVVVEVLDKNGNEIPGYTREQAKAISGDVLRAPASWNGKENLQELLGQKIKLRVYMKDTRLYSLTFTNS